MENKGNWRVCYIEDTLTIPQKLKWVTNQIGCRNKIFILKHLWLQILKQLKWYKRLTWPHKASNQINAWIKKHKTHNKKAMAKQNKTVQMNVSNSISRILVNMPYLQNLNSFFFSFLISKGYDDFFLPTWKCIHLLNK